MASGDVHAQQKTVSAREYDTGKYARLVTLVDENGNIGGNITLDATDIEIGAVEIKNAADDQRASVEAANTARTTATKVLAVQHVDAGGKVFNLDVANTARTAATLLNPTQHVDAAGVVGGVRPSAYATDDSAMPDTPAIMPIGGEYRSSATTYTDGDAVVDQHDVNGNKKVTMGTALSKVYDGITTRPEATTPTNLTASTNAIRTGAGILVGMYVNSTSSGTIKIYDNTAQSGTVLNNTITPATGYHPLGDATFATGLSVTVGGTLDVTLYHIPTP